MTHMSACIFIDPYVSTSTSVTISFFTSEFLDRSCSIWDLLCLPRIRYMLFFLLFFSFFFHSFYYGFGWAQVYPSLYRGLRYEGFFVLGFHCRNLPRTMRIFPHGFFFSIMFGLLLFPYLSFVILPILRNNRSFQGD